MRVFCEGLSGSDAYDYPQARRLVLENLTPRTVHAIQVQAVGGSTGTVKIKVTSKGDKLVFEKNNRRGAGGFNHG